MMNFLGKALVLVHAALSLGAMTWAGVTVIQSKDFGWMEPRRQAVGWDKEGKETAAVRIASEYDKSAAAVKEAIKMRDSTYVLVKPALDSIRETEPFLWNNHLFYVAALDQLRNASGNINVRRLKDAGMALKTPNSKLGEPAFDEPKVDTVNKSYIAYVADFQKHLKELDEVEKEIHTIVIKTKKHTTELTGMDEINKYLQPGLYQLIDLEYKAQTQLKAEIDDIKPQWSKAIQESRLFEYRRANLESTLEMLTAPMPKNGKK